MKRTLLILGIVIFVVGTVFLSVRYVNSRKKTDAINLAKEYQQKSNGEVDCTQSLTPAMHEQTGAKYVFETGCLAPGWTELPSYEVNNITD